ncbi:hypothetical protein [Microviridae sp.]|nr:hypothetical protein [Microviridae sp.]
MKGKQQFTLEHGTHKFAYTVPFPVLVSVNDVPVQVLNTGSGKAVLRNMKGTVTIEPSEPKGVYNIDIRSNLYPRDEIRNNEAPPQPAPSPNFLTAMRQKVKMSMGIIREEFADQRTIYEIGDEEVIDTLRQNAQSKAEEESDGNETVTSDAVNESTPSAESD